MGSTGYGLVLPKFGMRARLGGLIIYYGGGLLDNLYLMARCYTGRAMLKDVSG